MQNTDPLTSPALSSVAEAVNDWKNNHLQQSDFDGYVNSCETVIQSLDQYASESGDEHLHWKHRLVFARMFFEFDQALDQRRLQDATLDNDQQAVLERIRQQIDALLVPPLDAALKRFNSERPSTDDLDALITRAGKILNVLDLYAERGYYPTYEQWQQWQRSPDYNSDTDEGWFNEELERRSEDQYFAHSLIADISALEADAELSEADRARLDELAQSLLRKRNRL